MALLECPGGERRWAGSESNTRHKDLQCLEACNSELRGPTAAKEIDAFGEHELVPLGPCRLKFTDKTRTVGRRGNSCSPAPSPPHFDSVLLDRGMLRRSFRPAMPCLTLAVALTACGGGGGSNSPPPVPAVRTLAYVVSYCHEDAQSFSGSQRLEVVRAAGAPVTVAEIPT